MTDKRQLVRLTASAADLTAWRRVNDLIARRFNRVTLDLSQPTCVQPHLGGPVMAAATVYRPTSEGEAPDVVYLRITPITKTERDRAFKAYLLHAPPRVTGDGQRLLDVELAKAYAKVCVEVDSGLLDSSVQRTAEGDGHGR